MIDDRVMAYAFSYKKKRDLLLLSKEGVFDIADCKEFIRFASNHTTFVTYNEKLSYQYVPFEELKHVILIDKTPGVSVTDHVSKNKKFILSKLNEPKYLTREIISSRFKEVGNV